MENSTRKPAARGGGGKGNMLPSKGMGGGVRNKNKHLQDLENMKRDHRNKTDKVKLVLPKINGTGANNKIGNRFISQTAPAYSNKDHPYHRISTKKVGTTTRRTNAPVRRAANSTSNNQQEGRDVKPGSAPPAIAVTGMGGLRVIRDRRSGNKGAVKGGGGASNRR